MREEFTKLFLWFSRDNNHWYALYADYTINCLSEDYWRVQNSAFGLKCWDAYGQSIWMDRNTPAGI